MLLVYLKRRCYPLFSSKFLIGQLYSNWPGSSSRTVNSVHLLYCMILLFSPLPIYFILFYFSNQVAWNVVPAQHKPAKFDKFDFVKYLNMFSNNIDFQNP